jgi:putative transposase
VATLATGRHTFGSSVTRRQLANRPPTPFTPTMAGRPGELVQIDTTPLDVMAIIDDGVVGRVELTITLDVATRSIPSAVLRPKGTKAVDAALLLGRMLVPESMRPGWSPALAMAASPLPHRRLVDIDARLEHAASKPVIVPETIVCDRGQVFLSETFLRACSTLGISLQPAHPRTPTDKAVIERTFGSINTLFCQHVAGYTGPNVPRRGTNPEGAATWTLAELQELLDEWIVVGWQNRPHDALRDPAHPSGALSPNEMYAAMVAAAGYVPLTLSGEDYLELLPVTWRSINAYGIQIDHRTYDCIELDPYRRQPSGHTPKGGRWEIHYDPYDLTRVWLRTPDAWITVPWTHLPMVSAPFADFTWRHARQVAASRGLDATNETAVAQVLDDLLTRAGEHQPALTARIAARTRATTPTLTPVAVDEPDHSGPHDNENDDNGDGDGDGDGDGEATVIPFGMIDPESEADYL